MSGGDPRCLVCKGSGIVDAWGRSEPCACTEAPRRSLDVAPDPGWIAKSLGGILERAQAAQAAAEEHERTCSDRPCVQCRRFVCRCGAPVDGKQVCESCSDREALAWYLKPTRESIPSRFRWALDASPELVQSRIQGSAELVRRGLANPPSANVLFIGPSGAGKTSMAIAMLDAWVRQAPRERSGAMYAEAGWLARARARHRLGEEAPLVGACIAAPLLVLDDLGSEREDRDGCITDVVYRRHNDDRPTWVTTGVAGAGADVVAAFAEALARRYDGGFVRRILESGKRVHLGVKL